MLGTRLVIGFSMVGFMLAVLCVDEWLAPWFPLWFVAGARSCWGRGAGAGRPAGRDRAPGRRATRSSAG